MNDQPFRIIQRDPPDNPAIRSAARDAVRARRVPSALESLKESAPDFRMDERLEDAINTSLAVQAPLLLTGEPGTGKTQVAYYLSWYLGIELNEFIVRSTSTGADLKYSFDAVAYLRSAQHPGDDPRRERYEFVDKGVLWKAYECEQPCVVLIDEIDKAPRDFPNDLLHEIDQNYFDRPYRESERIGPPDWGAPIVVITSNAERRLPDAFLRRCIVHHIALDRDLIRRAVSARAIGLGVSDALQNRAIDLFWEIRAKPMIQKPPGTAELLTWLAALAARGANENDLEGDLRDLPALGALVKDHKDRDQL